MTSAVLDIDAAQEALVADLNAKLLADGAQAVVSDAAPPADAAMPYAVCYPLGLDIAYPAPLTAETLWPQQFQLTCVGQIPSQARKLAVKLDAYIAGLDTTGAYLHQLDLSAAGVAVTRRQSNRDGHGDVDGVLHLWVCTYTLDLQLI